MVTMPLNLKVGAILKRLGKPYVFAHVINTPVAATHNNFGSMGFDALVLTEAYSAYDEVTPTESNLTLVAVIYPPTPSTESNINKEVVAGVESVGVLCVVLPSDTIIGIDDFVQTTSGKYKITGVIDYDSYFEFYSVKV